MTAASPAKRDVHAGEQQSASTAAEPPQKAGLMAWLQSWKQVAMAELLNMLERRRYNLKSSR